MHVSIHQHYIRPFLTKNLIIGVVHSARTGVSIRGIG